MIRLTLLTVTVGGAWSWYHGRFDGQTLLVITAALVPACLLLLRDIDTQRLDRLTDPRPLPGERP